MKELLSVKEFSKATGMAQASIYRLVREKKIKHVRVGQRIFLSVDDLTIEKEGENKDVK